jgi:HTH-like domain
LNCTPIKLLGISRGGVYYRPQGVSEAELRVMRYINEVHLEHPFMGSRQLTRQLRRQRCEVGRLHVRTLMLRMGIQATAAQPRTSAGSQTLPIPAAQPYRRQAQDPVEITQQHQAVLVQLVFRQAISPRQAYRADLYIGKIA